MNRVTLNGEEIASRVPRVSGKALRVVLRRAYSTASHASFSPSAIITPPAARSTQVLLRS